MLFGLGSLLELVDMDRLLLSAYIISLRLFLSLSIVNAHRMVATW